MGDCFPKLFIRSNSAFVCAGNFTYWSQKIFSDQDAPVLNSPVIDLYFQTFVDMFTSDIELVRRSIKSALHPAIWTNIICILELFIRSKWLSCVCSSRFVVFRTSSMGEEINRWISSESIIEILWSKALTLCFHFMSDRILQFFLSKIKIRKVCNQKQLLKLFTWQKGWNKMERSFNIRSIALWRMTNSTRIGSCCSIFGLMSSTSSGVLFTRSNFLKTSRILPACAFLWLRYFVEVFWLQSKNLIFVLWSSKSMFFCDETLLVHFGQKLL